jgi:hypothetical protein
MTNITIPIRKNPDEIFRWESVGCGRFAAKNPIPTPMKTATDSRFISAVLLNETDELNVLSTHRTREESSRVRSGHIHQLSSN